MRALAIVVVLAGCGAALVPASEPVAAGPAAVEAVAAATAPAPTCADRTIAAVELLATDADAGREALSATVTALPECTIARVELGAALAADPTTASAAAEVLEPVLALEPENVRARELLVTAYLGSGALDAAESAAHALAESAHAELLLGLVASERDDPLAARAHFERAVALDASLFQARLALADVAEDTRDYATAATEYTAALWLRPSSYDAWLGRGMALRGLGHRFEEAEAAYLCAMELEPERPEAYFDAGVLFSDFGDHSDTSLSRAIGYFNDFVRLAGDRPDLAASVDAVVHRCDPEPPTGEGVSGDRGAALRARHRDWELSDCTPGRIQAMECMHCHRDDMAAIMAAMASMGASGSSAPPATPPLTPPTPPLPPPPVAPPYVSLTAPACGG